MIFGKKVKLSITLLALGFIVFHLIFYLLTFNSQTRYATSVDISGFNIPIYSLTAMLGIAVFLYIMDYFYSLFDIKIPNIEALYILSLVFGIVFGRGYLYLTEYESYKHISFLNFSSGGMSIVGVMIGVSLINFIYLSLFNVSRELIIKSFCFAILALMVSQPVGRLGNYINQELYGIPTDLSWAMYIEPEFRLEGYEDEDSYHPLYLYESIGNLVLFIIFVNIGKVFSISGFRLFSLLLLSHASLRFSMDIIRIEGVTGLYGLSFTQIIVILIVIVLFFTNTRYGRKD